MSKGFTLIELIVAVSLLAIISGISYSGLNSVLNSHKHLFEQQQRFNSLNRSLIRLKKELRHIVPRPVSNGFNGLLPALVLQQGSSLEFSFTRAALPNITSSKKSSLQRIDYIFTDNKLKKRIWFAVDREDNNTYKEELVAEDLESFSVELLGYDDKWYKEWANNTEHLDILPKAIKISFSTKEIPEINRLFVLPQ